MVNRPIDADVAIIGAGPAGSATAIACASRGLHVVLCERSPSARDRPGETLHPGIEPLLVELGVAARLPKVIGARHSGIWIEWGGPRRFESFGADAEGPWRGFQVWRADFDSMLVDRALELGVELRNACAATRVIMSDGVVSGIETASGPIAVRIVVDATGTARWLGRALGVQSTTHSPLLVARYGYVQGSCPERDDAPLLVGDASGWTWSARVRPGTYQWTSVRFGSRADGEAPAELRTLRALGPERGADVTWRMADRTAGAGWFIVGDAAATLDPTSSHGVLKALLSGMTAAHLIAASLASKAPAVEISNAYSAWISSHFMTDATRLRSFYRDLGAVGFT
jgi:flavin-dependent dehydrogenase